RLLRWTGNGPKGAKHAAVAVLRPQPHAASFALVKELTSIYRHLFAFREAAMRTGDHRIENDVFYGQMRLVLELRRQIRQPLWRSVDENGFYALVEPDQYENANDDEQHAKRSLEALNERQNLLAPALHRFAREEPDDQQRQRGAKAEYKHAQRDLW